MQPPRHFIRLGHNNNSTRPLKISLEKFLNKKLRLLQKRRSLMLYGPRQGKSFGKLPRRNQQHQQSASRLLSHPSFVSKWLFSHWSQQPSSDDGRVTGFSGPATGIERAMLEKWDKGQFQRESFISSTTSCDSKIQKKNKKKCNMMVKTVTKRMPKSAHPMASSKH